MKNSRSDVLYRTKLRLREKYDTTLIEKVEKNLWDTLRYYLSHPEEVTKGLYLNDVIKFKIRWGKVEYYFGSETFPEYKKEKLKKLLEQNGKTTRQSGEI